jgi:hypothetical protein
VPLRSVITYTAHPTTCSPAFLAVRPDGARGNRRALTARRYADTGRLWRRPRVVLADPHRPRRDRPGLHCVPPRAGQASAHPRRVSHPPFVTVQQRLPGRPRIVSQGGGSVPRSAAGSALRGMSRRESVPARPDRQSVCGRVLGHRSPNSLPSPRPGPRHHGRSACPCGGLRPGAHPGVELRYHRVIYLTAPAARGVVDRAAAALPPGLGPRLTVRDLPPEAFL